MKDLLKASAVVIYLMAVIAVFGVLPAALAAALKIVAVVLLALHVLEVPVEVEVHHCPASPTRGSPLLPDLEAALGSAHQKLAYTRSMPLDLAKAAGRLAEPQQICLSEHGQFIVRRETQSSWTGECGKV